MVDLLHIVIFSLVFIVQVSGLNAFLNPDLLSSQVARRSPSPSQTDEVNPFRSRLHGSQRTREWVSKRATLFKYAVWGYS